MLTRRGIIGGLGAFLAAPGGIVMPPMFTRTVIPWKISLSPEDWGKHRHLWAHGPPAAIG
jgi:hypothetical protein